MSSETAFFGRHSTSQPLIFSVDVQVARHGYRLWLSSRAHRARLLGRVRRDVDDPAAVSLPHHFTPHQLGEEKHGGSIDRDEMLPDLFSQLRDRDPVLADDRARIVDQDIDPAEVLDCLLDHTLDLIALTKVAWNRQAAAFQRADFTRDALEPLPSRAHLTRMNVLRLACHIRQHEIYAILRELQRGRTADALHAARAGDQGYLTLQSRHILPFSPAIFCPSVQTCVAS